MRSNSKEEKETQQKMIQGSRCYIKVESGRRRKPEEKEKKKTEPSAILSWIFKHIHDC
jgi:hypothetical protein